jgi:general secretion pathway protein I
VDRHLRRHRADGRASRRVSPGRASRGFTLIELLIALAIFAIVAVTVYTRSGEVIRQTGDLEERTLATWLADNELALLRMSRISSTAPLTTGSQTRQVVMSGRNWTVTDRISDTSNPWLRRVEVEVAPEDVRRSAPQAYRLTGFIGRY